MNILLMECNYYHALGLSLLITSQPGYDNPDKVCFLLPSEKKSIEKANIIFHDDRVTIQVYKKNNNFTKCNGEPGSNERVIIHVPFLTRGQPLNDIIMKINKILAIASTDYNFLIDREEVCLNFGLKKYAQLSDTENHVMILIGRGYNSSDISRILKRSQKTISTHYRNASRKMGAANRAEFYHFASFIAKCGYDERNILFL